jgi:hypothetical protein
MACLQVKVVSGTLPYVHCPAEVSTALRDHLLSRQIQCSVTGVVSSGDQHIDSLEIDPDADLDQVRAAVASFTGGLPDWFVDLDES